MENLKAASIYLDGANLFAALFIFFLICIITMFLALCYHIKSKELDRTKMRYKQLHKKYQTVCKERDDFSEKFYVADFQLDMKNRELDELRELHQGEEYSSADENNGEVSANV